MASIRRILSRAVLTTLPFLVACELDAGQPWSTVDLEAELIWDAKGRLDDDGRLQTSKNYQLAFENLTIELGEITVTTSSAKQISFDPAAPPPGYSLCHQGHCHNDKGMLIPYDVVSAELNQGTASAAMAQSVSDPVSINTNSESYRHEIALGACSDDLGLCEIGPENLTRIGISIKSVAIDVLITEDVEDGQSRLQAEVPVNIQLDTPATTELDGDGPESIAIKVDMTMRASLWDAFEFSDWRQADATLNTDAFREALVTNLPSHLELNINSID
jgi:hypothetical protein